MTCLFLKDLRIKPNFNKKWSLHLQSYAVPSFKLKSKLNYDEIPVYFTGWSGIHEFC
jgi:hypothetical protein